MLAASSAPPTNKHLTTYNVTTNHLIALGDQVVGDWWWQPPLVFAEGFGGQRARCASCAATKGGRWLLTFKLLYIL
jgi:hypothetical protein